jgi:hypothetical protein
VGLAGKDVLTVHRADELSLNGPALNVPDLRLSGAHARSSVNWAHGSSKTSAVKMVPGSTGTLTNGLC